MQKTPPFDIGASGVFVFQKMKARGHVWLETESKMLGVCNNPNIRFFHARGTLFEIAKHTAAEDLQATAPCRTASAVAVVSVLPTCNLHAAGRFPDLNEYPQESKMLMPGTDLLGIKEPMDSQTSENEGLRPWLGLDKQYLSRFMVCKGTRLSSMNFALTLSGLLSAGAACLNGHGQEATSSGEAEGNQFPPSATLSGAMADKVHQLIRESAINAFLICEDRQAGSQHVLRLERDLWLLQSLCARYEQYLRNVRAFQPRTAH